MDATSLAGGFKTPPVQSAQAFRGIMQAMARPGSINAVAGALPPAPASIAAGAVLLTLCDATTRVHLSGRFDHDLLRDWMTFQTSAPLVAPEEADFVLCDWGDVALETLKIGTPEYPDRAATVIVEMPELRQDGATLKGPGIKNLARFGLPETEAFQRNRLLFPLGLDFVFTCGSQVAALPRSTEVL